MTTFHEWMTHQEKVSYLTPRAMAEAAFNAGVAAERERIAKIQQSQAARSQRRARATLSVLQGKGLPFEEGSSE